MAEDTDAIFEWKGSDLPTIGDLVNALAALESREEAEQFMVAYRAHTDHADVNVGYVAGYCSPETMERILDWTGTGFGRQRALLSFRKGFDDPTKRGH